MRVLSRRERVIIGLGVAATVAVVITLYVVDPLLAHQRQTAELIPVREAALQRRRGLIAEGEGLAAEHQALAKQLEARASRFLSGPTAPLAAAELQKLTKDAAAAANVEVRSERVLPAVELPGLLEIAIELTVAGAIRETAALLAEIERVPRLLTMKDVKIRLVAQGQPRDLLTTIVVSGYVRRT